MPGLHGNLCICGYAWLQQGDGWYICAGGNHTLNERGLNLDEQVAELRNSQRRQGRASENRHDQENRRRHEDSFRAQEPQLARVKANQWKAEQAGRERAEQYARSHPDPQPAQPKPRRTIAPAPVAKQTGPSAADWENERKGERERAETLLGQSSMPSRPRPVPVSAVPSDRLKAEQAGRDRAARYAQANPIHIPAQTAPRPKPKASPAAPKKAPVQQTAAEWQEARAREQARAGILVSTTPSRPRGFGEITSEQINQGEFDRERAEAMNRIKAVHNAPRATPAVQPRQGVFFRQRALPAPAITNDFEKERAEAMARISAVHQAPTSRLAIEAGPVSNSPAQPQRGVPLALPSSIPQVGEDMPWLRQSATPTRKREEAYVPASRPKPKEQDKTMPWER